MTYPVQQPGTGTLSVPFRPVAAGLVNVIVEAVGVPADPGGGSTGGDGGTNGNGGTKVPRVQVFRPFTTAVQLDIFKPGASQPVATGLRHIDVTGVTVDNHIVFAVAADATEADLNADWRVQATSPPAGFSSKYPLARGNLNVTVRYQTVPGNLGKIDHIVVVMMENRSFDHMLGALGLPAASGGETRGDVDGLKGNEFNRDDSGTPQVVHLRQAPNATYPATYFLTDPGHGWDDVLTQVGSDTRTPDLGGTVGSNSGFVYNFTAQINKAAQSLPPGRNTVTADALIKGGLSHAIAFRPALPGTIAVVATPQRPPSHSESGKLGSVALRMPGSAADLDFVATPIGQTALGLSYPATAAQLGTAGNWTCTVTNGTESDLNFHIVITYVAEPHDLTNVEKPGEVMSYYTRAQLPIYYFLASNFAICDRWYASIPTDTWPNRLYGLTGGSGGLRETPSDASVETDPPGFLLKTIFETLQERQIDWNIFFSDLPFALIFTRLAQDATYNSRMRPIDELVQRAAQGNLPSFCWVDPNFQDVPDGQQLASDDHAPGDVSNGQAFIQRVYNALSGGPGWAKTLLVITYDEHGGFYDHVLPPGVPVIKLLPPETALAMTIPKPATLASAVAQNVSQPPLRPGGPPDDDPTMRCYGVRVPAIVVSPWVVPKSVSHDVHDHTSLLSTVLNRFSPADAGSMGSRTTSALTLDAMLSATTPTLEPQSAPAVAAVGQALPAPVVSSGTFVQSLRVWLLGY